MPFLRSFFTFSLLFVILITNAQDAKWLQGSWPGKAHYAGSDESQYFALNMRIFIVKGNKFEGIMSTMDPSDTTIRFDCTISGSVYDKYLVVEHSKVFYVKNSKGSRWQLSCVNCGSVRMPYKLENNIFSFKGTVDDCYKECNGTNEFARAVNTLDTGSQKAVYALMHVPQPENTAAIVAAQPVIHVAKDSIPATAKTEEPAAARVPLLPAGSISKTQTDKTTQTITVTAGLNKSPGLTLAENTTEPRPLPVTADTITLNKQNNKTAFVPVVPVKTNKPPALPEGFAERKINLIKTLPVDTDSVILKIYDNGIVDGDIVSVIYNGQVLIDKLSLTSHIVVIKIGVDKTKTNTLVFHAHNLGEFPPNTAQLEMIFGSKTEELTVSSDLTVSSSINIVYEKQ